MTRTLIMTKQEARKWLQVAKAGRGIVEVERSGLTFRFIPAELANIDREAKPYAITLPPIPPKTKRRVGR